MRVLKYSHRILSGHQETRTVVSLTPYYVLVTITSETSAHIQINNRMYSGFMRRNWGGLYYTFQSISRLNVIKQRSSPPLCPPTPEREVQEKAVVWLWKGTKTLPIAESGLWEVLPRSSQTFSADRRSHGQSSVILRKGDLCLLLSTKLRGPKHHDTKAFFSQSQLRAVAKIIPSHFFFSECSRADSSILMTVFTVFSFSLFRNGTRLSRTQPFLYLIGSPLRTKY